VASTTATAAIQNCLAMLPPAIFVLLSHIVACRWRREAQTTIRSGHVDNPIDRVKLRRIDGANEKSSQE
jgi:hypothetical protein